MYEAATIPSAGIKRRSWTDKIRDRLRTSKTDPGDNDWMDPWIDGHRAKAHPQTVPSLQGSVFVAANFVHDYRQKCVYPQGSLPLRSGQPLFAPAMIAKPRGRSATSPVDPYVSERDLRKYPMEEKKGSRTLVTVNADPDPAHAETTVAIDRPGLTVSGQRVCIFTGHDPTPPPSSERIESPNHVTKVILKITSEDQEPPKPKVQPSPRFARNSLLRRSLSDRISPSKSRQNLFHDTTRLQGLGRSRGSLTGLFSQSKPCLESEGLQPGKPSPAAVSNGQNLSVSCRSQGQITRRPTEPPPPPPVDPPTVPPRRIFRYSKADLEELSRSLKSAEDNESSTPEVAYFNGRPLQGTMISWAAWAGYRSEDPPSSQRLGPRDVDKGDSDKRGPHSAAPGRLWPSLSVGALESLVESDPADEDPIYEEIDDDDDDSPVFTRVGRGSFAGASRSDILRYIDELRARSDTKESSSADSEPSSPGIRAGSSATNQGLCDEFEDEDVGALLLAMRHNAPNRNSNRSNASSQSSDESALSATVPLSGSFQRQRIGGDIERNDSGVGSETSGTARLRRRIRSSPVRSSETEGSGTLPWCVDCDQPISAQDVTVVEEEVLSDPLVCNRCVRRRTERREVLAELLETEVRYGRDLRVLQDELYKPLLVAGLVPLRQLDAVFLNVSELSTQSQRFSQTLREAVEIALEQGDEDLLTVDVGKLFLSSKTEEMLDAFRRYCVKSGEASVLLSSLEKDRELLRIFLRASQLENPALRRMDLHAFLMVPVQRITKYPLLLGRLLRATASQDTEARETLREAQAKVESYLATINAETKELGTFARPWRRGNSTPNLASTSLLNLNVTTRTCSDDVIATRMRKIAMETLSWNENSQVIMEGLLKVTQPSDLLMTATRNRGRALKWQNVWAVLISLNHQSKPELQIDAENLDTSHPHFPLKPAVQEAALVLFKDLKAARPGPLLYRDPLLLSQCTISSEAELSNFFEVHHIVSKDSYICQVLDSSQIKLWLNKIKLLNLGLGRWRQRRNALAHVMMIN